MPFVILLSGIVFDTLSVCSAIPASIASKTAQWNGLARAVATEVIRKAVKYFLTIFATAMALVEADEDS